MQRTRSHTGAEADAPNERNCPAKSGECRIREVAIVVGEAMEAMGAMGGSVGGAGDDDNQLSRVQLTVWQASRLRVSPVISRSTTLLLVLAAPLGFTHEGFEVDPPVHITGIAMRTKRIMRCAVAADRPLNIGRGKSLGSQRTSSSL